MKKIQGAEAVITKSKNVITKSRVIKSYRHPKIDEKIRKLRTRSESKILIKSRNLIPVPKLIKSSEESKEIKMEFLGGNKLSEDLEKLDYKKISKQIGNNIAALHNHGIIHGDLTTSNLIYKDKKVYFIDFGLGFHSDKVEDKATDLHLIKEALEAKHPTIFKESWRDVLNSYKKRSNSAKQILSRLEKVEKRGRYKAQY